MQDQPTQKKRRERVKRHPGIYYRVGADGKRRYEFVYRDSNGRQRFEVVGSDLQETIDKQDATRKRLRGGEVVRPTKTKFGDLGDLWLPTQEARISRRTFEDYTLKLDRVRPFLGHRWVHTIGRQDIADLIVELSKIYAAQTVKNTLTPVSRVFSYAARNGLISQNPVALLDSDERPDVDDREQRILSQDEIEKLLTAATDTYRPVLATAVFTGAREMELLGLLWEDVDFDRQILRVRMQLSRYGNERVNVKGKKKSRDIVLMPALVQLLREHRARSPYSQDQDFVFSTASGKPMSWSNVIGQGLHKAVKNAKLRDPRPRFHDLRHTYASMLIAQGVDVMFVSAQLGHAKPDITLRVYAHLFSEALHAAQTREKMEAVFGNGLSTAASNGLETEPMAEVVELAAVQAKH